MSPRSRLSTVALRNLLLLPMFVTLTLLSPSQTAAQQLTLPRESPDTTLLSTGVIPEVLPEAPAPVGPGFWIVSSHQSPQSFDENCPRFCPGVLRFDDCVGYRQSTLGELSGSLQPGIPVCIAVHGAFVDWQSVCHESKCVWEWLQQACPNQPLQFIYFTWPSDRMMSALIQIDVGVLGRRASRNGFYLAELIQYMPAECPISLVAHSLGTRVVASSLHLMGGGTVEDIGYRYAGFQGRRIRTVFLASAIDHDWLNPEERFGRALCSTECLLNLKNCKDPCLKIYPLRRPFSSRALGNTGFTGKDRQELGFLSHKVYDMDVANVVGHAHFWPDYFRRPALSRSFGNYIFFPDYVTSAQLTPPEVPRSSALSDVPLSIPRHASR